MQRRTGIFALLLLTCVCGAVGWSSHRLLVRREASTLAIEDLRACRKLADGIKQLQQRPSMAALETKPPKGLAEQIDRIASDLRIPEGTVRSIEPETPRRVKKSSYKEQRTRVTLGALTLEQLTSVLIDITAAQPELRVSALHLLAPSREWPLREGAELWTAELTLTYYIFSPTSRPNAS